MVWSLVYNCVIGHFCLIFIRTVHYKCVNFYWIFVETIRIGPSAFLLAKNCTKSIELYDFDGTKLIVEEGTSIQLPIFAIHHDEHFYDEPNAFKPRRFESKPLNELKKSGHFLPFGDGPRICLGKSNYLHCFISTNQNSYHSNYRPKICSTSNKIGFGGNCTTLFNYRKFKNDRTNHCIRI